MEGKLLKTGKLGYTRLTTFAPIASVVIAFGGCSDTTVDHPTVPTSPMATQISPLAPLLSARITPAIDRMRIGETLTFSAKLEFGDGGVPPSGKLPIWSSTNPAVLVVDHIGQATAVSEGNATIEVGTHGHRVTRNIQVTPQDASKTGLLLSGLSQASLEFVE